MALNDPERYTLRSWLRSNEPNKDLSSFAKTKRNLQEVLETFQSTVALRLLTEEDENLSTHTSRLTNVSQYEVLAKSLGPEPFAL